MSLAEAEAVDGSTINLVCSTQSSLSGSETYKWFDKNGSPISGANSQQYSFAVAFTDAGDFQCSVVLLGAESSQSAAYALAGECVYDTAGKQIF